MITEFFYWASHILCGYTWAFEVLLSLTLLRTVTSDELTTCYQDREHLLLDKHTQCLVIWKLVMFSALTNRGFSSIANCTVISLVLVYFCGMELVLWVPCVFIWSTCLCCWWYCVTVLWDAEEELNSWLSNCFLTLASPPGREHGSELSMTLKHKIKW